MKKQMLAIVVASALLGVISTVQAAGFQLAETSATGLGRAYAGEAAMADNAAVQFRNPAMLSYLKGTQLSVGGVLVMPNIDIHGQAVPIDLATGQVAGLPIASHALDIADDAFIPNFYLSHQYDDQFTFGLALATNYGMATDLGDDFLGNHFGHEAHVTSFELNPNLAYRVNEQFSLGAGLRLVYGEGAIGAQSSIDTPFDLGLINPALAGTILPVNKGDHLKYMEGDDWQLAWQLGVAYQLNAMHRFGFNYRSEVDFNLEGDAKGFAFNPLDPSMVMAGSMSLALPATAELASYHQLSPQLAIHASINWTDWSSFEKLEAQIPSLGDASTQLVKQENWQDNWRYALGATYQLDDVHSIRGGIAYDTSAVDDELRTLTIPEVDRLWYSLGYSQQISTQLTLDISFTYIEMDDGEIVEPRANIDSDLSSVPFGGAYMGTVSGDTLLLGAQLSYRF